MVAKLNAFAKSSQFGRLKDVNDSFLRYSQACELQKKFLTKLLSSKSGRAVIAFSQWKSLPIPSDELKRKLANRFERGLSNFANKMLKFPIRQML